MNVWICFAVGYLSCDAGGVSTLNVSLWVDNTSVRQGIQSCRFGTDCDTATGSIGLSASRHRYCSPAAYYVNSPNPSQVVWSCEYLG